MIYNGLDTHSKFQYDISNSFRCIYHPKIFKKPKNAILEIFKSLIKLKRFELQGKKMTRMSII